MNVQTNDSNLKTQLNTLNYNSIAWAVLDFLILLLYLLGHGIMGCMPLHSGGKTFLFFLFLVGLF